MPNVTLVLRWNDTRGDTVISTRAITEMICDGVATIFGPEGSCHVEAIVTQSRNIPMIAYVRLLETSEAKRLSWNSRYSIKAWVFKTLNERLEFTDFFSRLHRNVQTTKRQRSQRSLELSRLIRKWVIDLNLHSRSSLITRFSMLLRWPSQSCRFSTITVGTSSQSSTRRPGRRSPIRWVNKQSRGTKRSIIRSRWSIDTNAVRITWSAVDRATGTT